MITAKNDWLALISLNPEKDLGHFKEAGIDGTNTVLKDKEYYRGVESIQKTFTKDGKFNENAFNLYYNSALQTYNQFVLEDFNEGLYDEFLYSPLSDSPYALGKKETPALIILKIANPTSKTAGMSSVFGEDVSKLSMREAALTLNVVDSETGEVLDWTPNDEDHRGIFDFWNLPTLVEATWDEDGTHIENDRQVNHYKGLAKLNKDGLPYYETLGKRDIAGKRILHLADTMTIDGSTANKWDPFDSDGLNKSVTATTASVVASVVPYFVPYVGPVYKWATIGKDLFLALGTFGKAGVDVFSDVDKPRGWEWMNNMDAMFLKLNYSTSDYGLENLFSYEGVANIIKDSLKQLYQQREISKLPGYLKMRPTDKTIPKSIMDSHGDEYLAKFGKTMKLALKDGDINENFIALALSTAKGTKALGELMARFNKISRQLGSWYMAAVQSADVYAVMKDAGFSPEYTAIGMVGSTLGFAALMNSSLGDVAVEGLGFNEAKDISKGLIKSEAGKLAKIMGATNLKTLAGRMAAIKGISSYITTKGLRLFANKIVMNMGKEALEEVSEEVFLDSLLGLMSATDWAFADNKNARYVPWEHDMGSRYLAAALGGFIGGGVFEGALNLEMKVLKLKSGLFGEAFKSVPKDTMGDLITLARNGGSESVVKDILRRMKKGKIASTTLSLDIDTEASDDKHTVFKPAKDADSSLNAIVGKFLIDFVRAVDSAINDDGMAINDEDVISRAMKRDAAITALAKEGGAAHLILNDFNAMLTDLVSSKMKLKSVPDGDKDAATKINLEISEKLKALDGFLTGDLLVNYTELLMFDLNANISAGFYNNNLVIYALSKGKPLLSLTDGERKALEEEFKQLKDNYPAMRREMFKAYKTMKLLLNPVFAQMTTPDGKSILDLTKQINTELQKTIDTFVGEVTKEEELELIKQGIEEYKEAYSNELLNNMFNSMLKANFNLDAAIEASIRESSQFAAAKDKLRLEKLRKSNFLAPGSDIATVGLNTDIRNALDPDKVTLANNMKLILLVFKQAQATYGFIDTLSANKLESLIDLYNNINAFEAIMAAKASDVFTKIGKDTIKLTGFKPVRIDSEWSTVDVGGNFSVTRTEDGEYILKVSDVEADPETVGGETSITALGETFYIEDSEKFVKSGKAEIPISEDIATRILRSELSRNPIRKWSDLDEASLAKEYFDDGLLEIRKEIVSEALALLKNVKQSPVMEALDIISKAISGESIIPILQLEEALYRSLSGADEYVINNAITEQLLQTLNTSLTILDSLLHSLTAVGDSDLFDLGTTLNKVKQSLGMPTDSLLTVEDRVSMKIDLSRILAKADWLLWLHGINSGSKILNNKKTGIRLNANLIRMFSLGLYNGNLPLLFSADNGEELNFFNFSDIVSPDEVTRIKLILEQGSVTEEDYKFTFEVLAKVNKAIYDRFLGLSETERALIVTLISSDKLFNRISDETNISKSATTDDMSGKFLADYLYMHMIADTSKFYDLVKSLISSKKSTYTPFAGQLLDIEFNWIFFHHAQELDGWLDAIKANSSRPIIREEINTRKHFMFNFGTPGSGKTTAVGSFTKLLLEIESGGELKVWYGGPIDSTALKLGKIMGDSVSSDGRFEHSFDKQLLFDKILTASGKEKLAKMLESEFKQNAEDGVTIKNRAGFFMLPGYLTREDFLDTSVLPDLLFLDEVTHFTSIEGEVLSMVTEQFGANMRIIGLGDIHLSWINDVNGLGMSVVLGLTVDSPNLDLSIRSANTTKLDNLAKLSSLVKLIGAKELEAIKSRVPFDVTNYIKSLLKDTILKFYEDDTTIHGEKIVTSISDDTINKLITNLEEGEKIAFITDNLNGDLAKKFDNLDKSKVVVVSSDKVLGAEYKYTILDVNWMKITPENTTAPAFLQELRRFYTLISRSTDGTIIIDPHQNCLVPRNERTVISREIDLSNEDITEYNKFLLNSLPGNIIVSLDPVHQSIEVQPVTTVTESVSFEGTVQEVKKAVAATIPTPDPKDEDPEFIDKHLVAFSEFKVDGGVSEDSNGLYILGRRGVNILKSALMKGAEATSDFIHNTSDMHVLRLLGELYRAFLPNVTPEAVLTLNAGIASGSYYIKVKIAEAGDIAYNRTPNLKTPKIGDPILKLVYRFNTGLETRDITLGLLGDTYNIDAVKEAVKNVKSGAPIYFETTPKFNVRKFEMRLGLDFEGTEKDLSKAALSLDWQRSNSIANLRIKHPDMVFSDPLVVTEDIPRPTRYSSVEKSGAMLRKGVQVVLASWDLSLSLADLVSTFLRYIKDPKNTDISHITTLVCTPVGMTPSDFFHLWRKLFYHDVNESVIKGSHQYLGGFMIGPKLSNILHDIGEYLKAPEQYKARKTFKLSVEEIEGIVAKIEATGVTKDTIIKTLEEELFSREKTTSSVGKLDLDIDFNKLAPSLLGLTKEEMSKLESTIKPGQDSAAALLAALEELKTDDENNRFTLLYTVFNLIMNKEGLAGTLELLMELFRAGVVPPIAHGAAITSRLATAYKYNEIFRLIMDIAVPNSSLFKYGIQMSPINRVAPMVKDLGLFSSGLSDDLLFIGNYIGTPRFYVANSLVSSKPEMFTKEEKLEAPTVEQVVAAEVVNEVETEGTTESISYSLDDFRSEMTDNIAKLSEEHAKYKYTLLSSLLNILGDTRDEMIDNILLILTTSYAGLAVYSAEGKVLGIMPAITVLKYGEGLDISFNKITNNKPSKYVSALKKASLDTSFTVNEDNISKLYFISSLEAIGIIDFIPTKLLLNTETGIDLSPIIGDEYSDIVKTLLADETKNIKTNC